jgi:serine phosphatase RsbU (regulator of sigma subunit)
VLKGYVVKEATGERVPVNGTLIIGRTAECGLLIEDSAASRRHVEITARGGSFVWKDLGSTNGTCVNGARMLAGELKPGDIMKIGETALSFEVEDVPDLPAAPAQPAANETNIFQETLMNVTGMVSTGARQSKTAELLQAVYSVMNDIAANYEPCTLIDRVLETTMRAINAQRGMVFLADAASTLKPCAVCGKVHTIQNGTLEAHELEEMRISSTVAQRVLQNGESVLYHDAGGDDILREAHSVMSLNLRSIVCVPLRAKQGIIGILYIDSDRPNQAYTEDDVLLATSVGSSAGLALENATMHQQILLSQRMEQEIETAWTIQEGFLVKLWPEDPRFAVYGETRPAKTVGGDFFDFVHTAPDIVGILIGDVSGKGVPAALTMAQLLAEFRLHAREHASPGKVLEALNENLTERSQRGMFCTMCYLVLDLASGVLTGANAGHSPCLIAGPGGVRFACDASGPPAGILTQQTYTDEIIPLSQGETVLLFTDGIAEARSIATLFEGAPEQASEEYGHEGLSRVVARLPAAHPRDLCAAIIADVNAYTAPLPPHDDCTMIALHYGGLGGGHGQ